MRALIALPLLVLLVLFALSNRADVALGLWPTELSLRAPLALVVLGALALGFLAGGVVVRISELRHRRRARQAEAKARRLEDELASLRPPSPPAMRS
jgi:uncharacterized integral membrane protein